MRHFYVLLLLLCTLGGAAYAQNGGSRKPKPKPPETEEETTETNTRPPVVVPPPTGGTRNPRTRVIRSTSGGSSSSGSIGPKKWKVRPGIYLGLRGDLGGAAGIKVDPMGNEQLLEVESLDPEGDPFVDADGNELGSSSTSNWGVNVGAHFRNKWGIQMGYDRSQLVYHAINNRPFASERIGGDLNSWELPYTQHAAHFGIEKAFLGPLKLSYLFWRLGVRAEWYRDGKSNVDPGTSDWREDGTGALWENDFAEGPTYVIAPEFGWHIGKRFQLSFLYQIPLRKLATQTYTHYENDVAIASNQVQVSSQQFLMRLQCDMFRLVPFNPRKKKPTEPIQEPVIVSPEPTPEPTPVDPSPVQETPPPPAIDFNCSQTEAYRLQKVHFRVSEAVFVDPVEAREELDALVEVLRACEDIKVEIAGHTESRGLEKKNLELSHDRAEMVRQYLIDHGIKRRRIKANGYGSSQPVASNADEEGRQLNRRVEIRIIR